MTIVRKFFVLNKLKRRAGLILVQKNNDVLIGLSVNPKIRNMNMPP